LNTGTTLEILRVEGKVAFEKETLINWAIGIDIISFLRRLRILAGMLFGPVDFDKENKLITLVTSSGVVGDRKMELGLGFLRKPEK